MSQDTVGGSKAAAMSPDVAARGAPLASGSQSSSASTAAVSPAPQHHHVKDSFFKLTLGSIGVVYGDIGTSPLYALKTALQHGEMGLRPPAR